jgi:hypothetical protein
LIISSQPLSFIFFFIVSTKKVDSCLLSPIKYIISPVNKNIIIAEKIKFQNGVKKQILIVEENNRHKTNTATERKRT